MQNRLKCAFFIMMMSLLAVTFLLVDRMLFYDEIALTALSEQYFSTVEYIYPRGNITDRSGISFNYSFSSVFPEIRTNPDSYPSVAPQVVGKTETDPYDTTEEGKYGVNGINLIYNDLLSGGSGVEISAVRDANGNIIRSMGAFSLNGHINEGCDITLTLDYILQKETEKIMRDFSSEKGYKQIAATLTDCETGEIIVMATVGSEMNLNVLTYQPGSIMKIISAAVALEEGIFQPDDIFTCHGEFPVGEEVRHCSGKTVHGEITMKEAFANSCNEWAYLINRSLCSEKDGIFTNRALEMAKEWGFSVYGEESHEFILENKGYYSFVPDKLYNDMDIFNSSLGQGNIQASVYLINKITSAIANGGKIIKPHIISRITDPAGNELKTGEEEVFSLGLKDRTVSSLKELMREVCLSGSAKDVKTYGSAGKTGTAENIPGGKCHSWFTGYFPTTDGNFALTVFIPGGSNAPYSAVPLWDRIAENVVSFYE